jgi:uncharacterized coiled-coil protein SlyX
MEPELEPRLDRIETHLAHVERLVDQLNEAVVAQGQTIERLQARLTRQAQTIAAWELERVKNTNPKPPHYQ